MTITAILNCYRRPYNLEEQIQSIRSQSVPPREIWIWQNYHPDADNYDLSNLNADKIISSSHNFKFHGRFALALLANPGHIALFDDDTIPGAKWIENCLDTERFIISRTGKSPILGSAGIVLNSSRYIDHVRVGWPSQNDHITEVDLVGHAWFFNQEVLHHMWSEAPISLENGEDIQLSAMAKRHGHRTYCPPHPASDKSKWGSIKAEELGIDDKATSNNNETSHAQFFSERDYVIQMCLRKGWSTVRNIH